MTESLWQNHLETCVRAACLLEATARKPGNVHPEASFADLQYEDFVRSAHAIAPILAKAGLAKAALTNSCERRVGATILEAVRATRAAVGRNTNLGIILLLAPLAAVPEGVALADGIEDQLRGLTIEDARLTYEAIREAHPGGMGRVDSEDVAEAPRITLREAMRLAADRDTIAAQYSGRFEAVLDFGVPELAAMGPFAEAWEDRVIRLQLRLMERFPDTLIARKRGRAEATDASRRAAAVLAARPDEYPQRLRAFDDWLRAEGNSRNPGTTADLVTATLFSAWREGRISSQ